MEENNFQTYLNEMIRLTAEIAEDLLMVKDDSKAWNPAIADKSQRMAELAAAINGLQPQEADADDEVAEDAEPAVEDEESVAELNEEAPAEEEVSNEPMADVENEGTAQAAEFEEAEDAAPNEPEVESLTDSIPEYTQVSDQTPESVPGHIPESASDMAPASSRTLSLTPRQLREAMSLNDIFLYQRTLFGGSSQQFKDALEKICRCQNIFEVQHFLRDDCGINLKQREAKDFMSVIEPMFD